jgi:hypothetical protein
MDPRQDALPGRIGSAVSVASAQEAARRFHDILVLVSHEPVRTAYEVAQRLGMPLSSTYLAMAEMERLGCLSRDESGYMLTGARIQQMGLDARKIRVSAQRLPPLIRYLSDHTGHTAFFASMADPLVVGTVATGTAQNHVSVQPFQVYRKVRVIEEAATGAISKMRLIDDTTYEDRVVPGREIDVYSLPLDDADTGSHGTGLLICVTCAADAIIDAQNTTRRLKDVKEFFMNSRSSEHP